MPEKWWGKRQSCPGCKSDNLRSVFASPAYRCRACGSKWLDKHLERNGAEFFCGPDLELPENICHAFTVADALCAPGFRTEVWWVEERKLFSGTLDDGFNEIFAPERHLALVAACEAALGIQHEKENT